MSCFKGADTHTHAHTHTHTQFTHYVLKSWRMVTLLSKSITPEAIWFFPSIVNMWCFTVSQDFIGITTHCFNIVYIKGSFNGSNITLTLIYDPALYVLALLSSISEPESDIMDKQVFTCRL